MSLRERLKIFPLLIFVAMLSMAVRLGEVVTGVSHISASAFAESAKTEEPPAEEKPHDTPAAAPETPQAQTPETGTQVAQDAPAADTDGKTVDAEKALSKEEKEIIWRDAGDSDLGSTAVKMEMFEDLTKRREALDSQERDLATREALLQAAEAELDRKYQELDTIREEITNLLKQQSEEEKARIESIVKVYEGMKPKEAATIFDTMDLDILLQVMTRMSERKLSPILAAMNPERARTITIMMAEQKKLPELPLNN